MKTATKYILLGIIVLASFIRLYKLGAVPLSMYIDEVAIGMDARAIAETGMDIHGNSLFSPIFPSYGDYKLPVYIWMAEASVKMFGSTEFAVRLPSAIAGILTVLLVFELVRELFNEHKTRDHIALFAAAITAILPWSVLFSRTGFEGHVAQMFILLSIVSALKVRRRPRFVCLAVLAGVAAVYTYYSARFVFPVVYIGALAVGMRKKWKDVGWKRFLVFSVGGLITFTLMLLPMTQSPLYEPMQQIRLSTKNVLDDTDPILRANMLQEREGRSLLSRVVEHRTLYRAKELAQHYADYVNLSFLFLHGDANLRHSTGQVGLMYLAFLPFFISGICAIAKKEKAIGVFLLIWYLTALLPAAVPFDTPHALRSLNALGVFVIVCGVGAHELCLWSAQKNIVHRLLGFSLLFLLMFNISAFFHDYFVHYPLRSASAWYDGKKQAAILVKEKFGKVKKIEVTSGDRMFMWIAFYADIPVAEIQSAPEHGYVKDTIGKITFRPLSTTDMHEDGLLIVGSRRELTSVTKESIPIPSQGEEQFSYLLTGEK